MPVEVRYVADGTERQSWTTLWQAPGETDKQVLDRKQASHEALGWTVTRSGNQMTAVKDYPQNEGKPHADHKERYFRVVAGR